MEGSTGAPPQRVCPKCARISWATGPQCPYCRARFRRPPGVTPWMLALAAAIVLVCVAVMFLIAGNELDKRLDQRATDIERSIDADLNRSREDVRRELEAQQTPAPIPTPFPTPTPTREGEPTPEAGETPTPEAGETPTPSFDDPNPTPTPTIQP